MLSALDQTPITYPLLQSLQVDNGRYVVVIDYDSNLAENDTDQKIYKTITLLFFESVIDEFSFENLKSNHRLGLGIVAGHTLRALYLHRDRRSQIRETDQVLLKNQEEVLGLLSNFDIMDLQDSDYEGILQDALRQLKAPSLTIYEMSVFFFESSVPIAGIFCFFIDGFKEVTTGRLSKLNQALVLSWAHHLDKKIYQELLKNKKILFALFEEGMCTECHFSEEMLEYAKSSNQIVIRTQNQMGLLRDKPQIKGIAANRYNKSVNSLWFAFQKKQKPQDHCVIS